MKTKITTLVALVLGMSAHAQAGLVEYDLSKDWSDTENGTGVWSYNAGNQAIANYSEGLFPNDYSNAGWTYGDPGVRPYIPAWMKMESDFNNIRVGDVVAHTWDGYNGPGNRADANITWTSPQDGLIDIQGYTWEIRTLRRAISWSLTLNDTQLASGNFLGDGSSALATPDYFATDDNPLNGLAVSSGDVLKLNYVTNKSNPGDFVGVNLSVNLTPQAIAANESQSAALFAFSCLALLTSRRRKTS